MLVRKIKLDWSENGSAWKTSTYLLIGTAVLAGIGALYYLSKPGPPESAIMKQDDLDDFTKDFSDEMEKLLTLAENNA